MPLSIITLVKRAATYDAMMTHKNSVALAPLDV